MNPLGIIFVGIVILIAYLVREYMICKSATEYPGFHMYYPMVRAHADKNGVDWRLVAAHITVESGWNPMLVNYQDNEAIGLGQILCRPDGKGGCANPLSIPAWVGITRAALFDAETNVEIICQLIEDNQKHYGLVRGIAVYNDWQSHKGAIANIDYVDKVLCVLHKLQMEYPND